MARGLAAALLVVACGSGGASIAPSGHSASPSPADLATPTPTVRPSATPTAPPTTALPATPTASRGAGGPGSIPRFDHVYVIVMENKEANRIVGNPDAAFLNGLAARYGQATSYHAVTHPSQPNYLALFAGSTFGIRDNDRHDIDAPTIADQLEAAGRSWHVYAQNLPSPCFTGATAHGGPDLDGPAGWYVRKHEPAISFTSISGDPARCAAITPLAAFDPAAADFALIVPNLTNDMHDGSIAQGDAFLRAFVPRITGSAAFADSLLVITFDEGNTAVGGGGAVATVLVSPLIAPGTTSDVEHDHYSLLRTIQEAWGLDCLAGSCGANDLGELFSR